MPLHRFKDFLRRHLPKPILRPLLSINERLRRAGGAPQRFVELPGSSSSLGSASPADAELVSYFRLLLGFDHRNTIALDRAHNMFLIGAVLSQKPRNVLELGIGTGYVTASVALALRYNQVGTLTSVDNWFDTRGDEPPLAADLRKQGVNVVCSGEEEFVRQAATDAYDLLISDADHFRSPEWLNEHLRIVKPGGLMFFHDTNSPQEYPALATLEPRIAQLGLPYYHFKQSSRADEHCDRGWLFVMNRKSEDGNA